MSIQLVPSCGFAITKCVDNVNQYLLLKKKQYGLWEIPKGKIEKDESELETAFREIEEECGIKKDNLEVNLNMKKVYRHFTPKGKEKTLIFWLARLIKDDIVVTLSEEHVDYKWVTAEEANHLLPYDDLKDCIKSCENQISKIE